jgi:hypothetical protein
MPERRDIEMLFKPVVKRPISDRRTEEKNANTDVEFWGGFLKFTPGRLDHEINPWGTIPRRVIA